MYRRSRSLRSQMSSSRAALNRPWLNEGEGLDPKRHHGGGGLLVVQTLAVEGPKGTGISHWEIHLAADADARPLVLLTRDEPTYKRALAAEGTNLRFQITYHPSQRPDGSWCSRIDALEELPR